MAYKPVHYHSYLGLDKVLNAQKPLSDETPQPAHDEHLFIIVHQAYELWFKQILHDLDSVLKMFEAPTLNDKSMGIAIGRLERIIEIQKLLIDQVHLIETMTPLDFLEFRNLLYPASGFQSLQFRVLEIKLGLQSQNRLTYNQFPYYEHFPEDQKKKLLELENQNSLFDSVEKWLERTPFLKTSEFDFWQSYQKAVTAMFNKEKQMIKDNPMLSDEDRERNYKIIAQSESIFSALFDKDQYQSMRETGQWRLSYEAVRAALFIQLYRHQPILYLPFRLITCLLNIDELMTNWRYRHSLMTKRMLGTKVGTGGSSGAQYLRDSTEKHKIFSDYFQLTTFFIPRSDLPELPESFEYKLGFREGT